MALAKSRPCKTALETGMKRLIKTKFQEQSLSRPEDEKLVEDQGYVQREDGSNEGVTLGVSKPTVRMSLADFPKAAEGKRAPRRLLRGSSGSVRVALDDNEA